MCDKLKEVKWEQDKRLAAAEKARMKAAETRRKASMALERDAKAIEELDLAESRLHEQNLVVEEAERAVSLSGSTPGLLTQRQPVPTLRFFGSRRRPRVNPSQPEYDPNEDINSSDSDSSAPGSSAVPLSGMAYDD